MLARAHSRGAWFWRLSLALLSSGCVPEDPPEGPRQRGRFGSGVAPRAAAAPPKALAPAASQLPFAASFSQGAARTDPILREAFSDDFDRETLGPNYRTRSEAWRVSRGRLCGVRAHNQPVWLLRRLPTNARIEFDAASSSSDGDIKVEAWGDGESGASGLSYTNATGYLAIFGGWKNSLHVLARKDEHGTNRKELELDPESDDPRSMPAESERGYRFRIERRDGKTVRWFVDDIEILSFTDPEPLAHTGHDHFGFNDWETPVCFDNLDILPLD